MKIFSILTWSDVILNQICWILLKEWVLESNNPDDEDMEMILEFLLKLIKCWRLDLLENYLKCLRRTIIKTRMVLHLFSFFDFPLIGLMTLGGVTCDLTCDLCKCVMLVTNQWYDTKLQAWSVGWMEDCLWVHSDWSAISNVEGI